MKPVACSLTKTDFSNDRAPPVVCWSRYLRTMKDAEKVADRDSGDKIIFWRGAGDGVVGNNGYISYYVEAVRPMSAAEAIESLPQERKSPKKKRAAK